MRKFIACTLLLLASAQISAQRIEQPIGFTDASALHSVENVELSSFVWEDLFSHAQEEEERSGKTLQGKVIYEAMSPETVGTWTELENGTKVWRVQMSSEDALSISTYFDDFFIPEGASLFIYNADRTYFEGPIGSEENNGHGRYVTNDIWGESITLEYVQPADVVGEAHLGIMGAGYFFQYVYPPAILEDSERGSGSCQVEVNCPEGEDWQFQRDAIVRLRITDDGDIGLCSGAMVNTTARDCRQYLLSALHCADNVSDDDFAFLQVRFNYERPLSDIPFQECTVGSFSSSRNRTGVVHLADSDDNSFQGFQGSDFLLLEVEDQIPGDWNPFFAGWEAANLGSQRGVGIHHPNGDLKKISTYTDPTTSVFIGAPGSHWEVTWAETQTNQGTTEGGSSGSPLFNAEGKIIGTLSAGLSDCFNQGQFGPDEPDWYGKMSYHWTNNPNNADQKLRVWLDPNDLGWTTLWGSYMNEGGDCDPFLSIPENSLDLNAFQISPNPSPGQLNIKITDDALNGTIQVFDLQGKIIFSEQIAGPVHTYDLSTLNSGIYYVIISNAEGQSRTKKWSKI